MTSISHFEIPKTSEGNDPNDHQHDPQFLDKLKLVSTDEQTPPVTTLKPSLPDNEDDLALIFTREYINTFKFDSIKGDWYRWDGKVWFKDKGKSVLNEIRVMCRENIYTDIKLRKRFLTARSISSLETLVRHEPTHQCLLDQWDHNDSTINTPLGIIDLITGDLLPHDPHQLCTKITTVGPKGKCPTFKKFLKQVTGGDKKLMRYIQKLFGYAAVNATQNPQLFAE